MHYNPNDSTFRCCYGVLSRDHGAFNYLYRWSVRHMLTEVLVVGLLVYLQFQDASVGLWSMSAAVISLIGASIPTCCISSAMGWRVNFALQIFVCLMRVAIVTYIVIYFTKVSFTENTLAVVRDMNLIAVRICQLACILLSTCSLSPFFHLSFKSPWLINLRPLDDNYRNSNNNNDNNSQHPGNNRIYANNEGYMTDRSMDTRDNYYDSDNNYPRKGGHVAQSSVSGDSVQSDDVYYFNEKNKKNHNNNHNENMEIENIEEGNEEEDGNDDDANSPKSGRGGPPSVLSYASMTPFYRKQPQTVFDFSTKLDIEFNNPMNEEGSVGSSRKGGSTKSGTFKKKEFGSPLNAPLSSAPISIKAIPDRMKSPQGSNKSGFNMNDGNNSNSVSAKKYFYNENNSHTEIDTMEAASDKNIEIIDFMDSVTNNSNRSKPISIRSANSSGKLSGRKEVAVENTFTPRDPFRTYGVPNPNNNHNQAGPESIMTGFDNINGNNGSNGNGNAISRFSPRGMNAEKGNNNTELFSVSAISSKKHNKGESELKDHQT